MKIGSCGACVYKYHKYPSCPCKYTIHDKNRVYVGRDYTHNQASVLLSTKMHLRWDTGF